jgi:hypothetical protein
MPTLKEIQMNLKIVKWLLAHQSVLLKVVEVAKTYNKTLPWVKQWDVVDQIARIVLPIMEAELTTPKTLAVDEPVADREVQILSLQNEYAALGVDWKLVVEVIIPLIVALLRALYGTDE